MPGGVRDRLAGQPQVVAIDLQGRGHTRDVDRPLSVEALGDDLAGLIGNFGLVQAHLRETPWAVVPACIAPFGTRTECGGWRSSQFRIGAHSGARPELLGR